VLKTKLSLKSKIKISMGIDYFLNLIYKTTTLKNAAKYFI